MRDRSYTVKGTKYVLRCLRFSSSQIRLSANERLPLHRQSVQDAGSFEVHLPSCELCATQEAALCFADLVSVYVLLPHLASRDIEKLERVQRKATKFILSNYKY